MHVCIFMYSCMHICMMYMCVCVSLYNYRNTYMLTKSYGEHNYYDNIIFKVLKYKSYYIKNYIYYFKSIKGMSRTLFW